MSYQLVIQLDQPYDVIVNGNAVTLPDGKITIPFARRMDAERARLRLGLSVHRARDDFAKGGPVVPGQVIKGEVERASDQPE